MTEQSPCPLFFCPPSIAVHDDGDVLRQIMHVNGIFHHLDINRKWECKVGGFFWHWKGYVLRYQ
jgi:hypothetical protein